jgi:hypothetical protein
MAKERNYTVVLLHSDNEVEEIGYLVAKGCGCTKCGEERMDYLEIDDDDVTCLKCGHKYQI